MQKSKTIGWLGMIGALATGIAQILGGDYVGGAGVVAAALSSAQLFGKSA